eukprot:jgi/Mesvir1/1481/Mv14464-RA.1
MAIVTRPPVTWKPATATNVRPPTTPAPTTTAAVRPPSSSTTGKYDDNNPVHVQYKSGLFTYWGQLKAATPSQAVTINAALAKYITNIKNDAKAAFTDYDFQELKKNYENRAYPLASKAPPPAAVAMATYTPTQLEWKTRLVDAWKAVKANNNEATQSFATTTESQARRVAYFKDADIAKFKSEIGGVPDRLAPTPTVPAMPTARPPAPPTAPTATVPSPTPPTATAPAPSAPVAFDDTNPDHMRMHNAIVGAMYNAATQPSAENTSILDNLVAKAKTDLRWSDSAFLYVQNDFKQDHPGVPLPSRTPSLAPPPPPTTTAPPLPPPTLTTAAPPPPPTMTAEQLSGLRQALGGAGTALATAGTLSNGDMGNKIKDFLKLPNNANVKFSVTNKTMNATGMWSSTQILSYLNRTTWPASSVGTFPNNAAFVSSWTVSRDGSVAFTVRWKSADHGYAYELSSAIPAPTPTPAPTPAPTNQNSQNPTGVFVASNSTHVTYRDQLFAQWEKCVQTPTQQCLDITTLLENKARMDTNWSADTIGLLRTEFGAKAQNDDLQKRIAEGEKAADDGRLKDAKAILGGIRSYQGRVTQAFLEQKKEEIKTKIRGFVTRRDIASAEALLTFAIDQEVLWDVEKDKYKTAVDLLKRQKDDTTEFDTTMKALVVKWNSGNVIEAVKGEKEIVKPYNSSAISGRPEPTDIDQLAKTIAMEMAGFASANKEPTFQKNALSMETRRQKIVDAIIAFKVANQDGKAAELRTLALDNGYFANANGLDQLTAISERLSVAYWDEDEQDIGLYFHSCQTWNLVCPGAHMICSLCYNALKKKDVSFQEQLRNVSGCDLEEPEEDHHELTHRDYKQLSKDAMVLLCNLKGVHLSDMLTWA